MSNSKDNLKPEGRKGMRLRTFFFLVLFISLSLFVLVNFYSHIFARRVKGSIMAVERVNPQMAFLAADGQAPSAQLFSFAVGVKDEKTNEIVTGSTEDRQWAVARTNQCVEALFFPYPPWNINKWGTYYNVRLLKLFECSDK